MARGGKKKERKRFPVMPVAIGAVMLIAGFAIGLGARFALAPRDEPPRPAPQASAGPAPRPSRQPPMKVALPPDYEPARLPRAAQPVEPVEVRPPAEPPPLPRAADPYEWGHSHPPAEATPPAAPANDLAADAREVLAALNPPPALSDPSQPPWLRFAAAVPATGGRPMVAVVVDDLGVDRRRSERVLTLPGPLTTAFLPYARELGPQTQAARARGHELLVHVPMEPQDEAEDPGPEALRAAAGAEVIRQRLGQGLSRFGGFVGINNHMGSRFTSDAGAMRVLMSVLKEHGLMFLDSVTSERTVGRMTAREAGVPFVARDVFLDDRNDAEAVARQLDRLEETARRNGAAVAICHPRDITIDALSRWLPTLEAKGLVLVPLSAVARRNGGA